MSINILKSTLALASGAIAFTPLVAEELTIESVFAFESEYSFRGVKLGGAQLQPGIEAAYGPGYAGVWSSSSLKSGESLNEVDLYGGFEFQVAPELAFDVGFTYYWYPNVAGEEATREVYIGTGMDLPFEPAFYVFYDFDLEDWILETSIGESFPLEGPLAIDVGAYLGYYIADGAPDYWYYGLTADLVYEINPNASVSVGGRYAGNSESILPNNQVYWGAAATLAF